MKSIFHHYIILIDIGLGRLLLIAYLDNESTTFNHFLAYTIRFFSGAQLSGCAVPAF